MLQKRIVGAHVACNAKIELFEKCRQRLVWPADIHRFYRARSPLERSTLQINSSVCSPLTRRLLRGAGRRRRLRRLLHHMPRRLDHVPHLQQVLVAWNCKWKQFCRGLQPSCFPFFWCSRSPTPRNQEMRCARHAVLGGRELI